MALVVLQQRHVDPIVLVKRLKLLAMFLVHQRWCLFAGSVLHQKFAGSVLHQHQEFAGYVL